MQGEAAQEEAAEENALGAYLATLWGGPAMRQVLAAHDFGAVYRVLARQFTYSQIAKMVFTSKSDVEETAERGKKVMHYTRVKWNAKGLHIPPGYVGLACCPCEHSKETPVEPDRQWTFSGERPPPRAVWNTPRARAMLNEHLMGAALRYLATELGYKQGQLARLVHRHQPGLSVMISKPTLPTLSYAVLRDYARRLNIPPAYLRLACCKCPHYTPQESV